MIDFKLKFLTFFFFLIIWACKLQSTYCGCIQLILDFWKVYNTNDHLEIRNNVLKTLISPKLKIKSKVRMKFTFNGTIESKMSLHTYASKCYLHISLNQNGQVSSFKSREMIPTFINQYPNVHTFLIHSIDWGWTSFTMVPWP